MTLVLHALFTMHYSLSNNFIVFPHHISLKFANSLHTSCQHMHPIFFSQMSEIIICFTILIIKVYC